MKPSRVGWIENTYPLVDLRMTRWECEELLRVQGLEAPAKSACVYCPFHDDHYWRDLRDNHPDEWRRAVAFDEAIRGMGKSPELGEMFVHRSLVPLVDAPLTGEGQIDLFGQECEGMCGV